MRVLFVCNQNQHRSKTAEHLFRDKFEARSAGLYNERPVTEEQMSWADLIMVMEDSQREELSKRFPSLYLQKRILSLNVPDVFRYNQPELVDSLKLKVEALL